MTTPQRWAIPDWMQRYRSIIDAVVPEGETVAGLVNMTGNMALSDPRRVARHAVHQRIVTLQTLYDAGELRYEGNHHAI